MCVLFSVKCEAGYERKDSSSDCTECEVGKYQSSSAGLTCTACEAPKTMTLNTGSKASSDCGK